MCCFACHYSLASSYAKQAPSPTQPAHSCHGRGIELPAPADSSGSIDREALLLFPSLLAIPLYPAPLNPHWHWCYGRSHTWSARPRASPLGWLWLWLHSGHRHRFDLGGRDPLGLPVCSGLWIHNHSGSWARGQALGSALCDPLEDLGQAGLGQVYLVQSGIPSLQLAENIKHPRCIQIIIIIIIINFILYSAFKSCISKCFTKTYRKKYIEIDIEKKIIIINK